MPQRFKQVWHWINGTTQRRLIFWSLCFWVLSVTILSEVFLVVGQNQMLLESRQRNIQLASMISRDVNAKLGSIIGNTRVFVQHLAMINPDLNSQATAILGLRLSSLQYRAVYYFDSSGKLLFQVTDNVQNLALMKNADEIVIRPFVPVKEEIANSFKAAIGTNMFVSDVYYTQLDQTPIVYLGGSITFPSGETRVIVSEMDLDEILQKIELSAVGQTGVTYAVSRTGAIIIHSSPDYIGRQIPVQITPVLSNNEGQAEYFEPFKKLDVIAAYSPVGGPTGWGIVVEQDKSEVYSTINSTGSLIVVIWAVLALIGTFSIFFLITGFTRPIKALTKTVRTISVTGSLIRTGQERRSDEIGQLSQAFDQMIERVNQAQRDKEEATLAERTRLARELHDAVSQTLFSASIIADVLPRIWEKDQEQGHRRLEEIRELTRGALAEMRTLLFELRPTALADANIKELVTQLVQGAIGRARIPIELEVNGECNLTPEAKIALYRICQEALNNVIKHASAAKAGITLDCTEDIVKVEIYDNGQGFDPGLTHSGSLGMGIMKERAKAIGAFLTVKSEPGKGTRIIVTWENPDSKEG